MEKDQAMVFQEEILKLVVESDNISVKQLLDRARALPTLAGKVGGREKFIEKLKAAGFTVYDSFPVGQTKAAVRVTV